MPSPRFLRPDTITVLNLIGEEDNIKKYQYTKIDYVTIDETYSIKQSKKGIENSDSVLILFDVEDYESDRTFKPQKINQFSFTFKNGDYIYLGCTDKNFKDLKNSGKLLMINKVNYLKDFGEIKFVEVYCS